MTPHDLAQRLVDARRQHRLIDAPPPDSLPPDAATAYAIQQAGSILISRMDGCYYNVMGLPVNTVKELLLKAGIDLWHFLKPC